MIYPMEGSYVRPSKDAYYLGIAKAVAQRATCLRRIYGAVIVNNDEIVSTGYNGSARGERNCCDTGKCYRRLHQVPHGQMVEKCCLTGDTVIKLLDGTYKTIAELASEKQKNFWVYAIDTNTGRIVPALASTALFNGERSDLMMMDRGEHSKLSMTPERIEILKANAYKGRETMRRLLETNSEYRDKKSKVGRENMRKNWMNHEFKEHMMTINKENGRIEIARLNSSTEMRKRMIQGKISQGLSLLQFRMKKEGDNREITRDIYDELQRKYKSIGRRGAISVPTLKTIIKYFGDFQTALRHAAHYNHKILKIEKIHSKEKVYDISVPHYHNFAVDLGDNSCIFVHNCAVHAEENAIISASRREMQGATLYLWGMDVETGKELPTPEPCLQCWRRIHNAGIVRVVTMGGDAHAPQSARRD